METQIITYYKQGQKEKAFELMVRNYHAMIFTYANKMLCNKMDAADTCQNTYAKAWQYFDSFKMQSSFGTWLFKIAINETLTVLNKKAKLRYEELANHDIAEQDGIGANEIERRLQYAIESLPIKQKQVFIMRYYDSLSYEAMSEILETSIGALKASYHIAVKKIEEMLRTN